MVHQDQEYQVLAAEAARRGEPPETLLRDLIQQLQPASAEKRPMTGRELRYLYWLLSPSVPKNGSLTVANALPSNHYTPPMRMSHLFGEPCANSLPASVWASTASLTIFPASTVCRAGSSLSEACDSSQGGSFEISSAMEPTSCHLCCSST